MVRRTGKTSAPAVLTIERRLEAVRLRKEGLTYAMIAHEMKLGGPNGAHQLVIGALRETANLTAEETISLRELEGERLDGLIRAHWPRATTVSEDEQCSHKSADIVLRCIGMRAKIFGLEAPLKVSNPDGTPLKLLDWASLAAAAQKLEQEKNTIDVTPEPAVPALGDGGGYD